LTIFGKMNKDATSIPLFAVIKGKTGDDK